MIAQMWMFVLFGVGVGIGAAFSGLGGGFLMVPLLLFLGYSAQKSVGTSFFAILVISISALVAHNKLANVDYKAGILLGLGGIVGYQWDWRPFSLRLGGGFRYLWITAEEGDGTIELQVEGFAPALDASIGFTF